MRFILGLQKSVENKFFLNKNYFKSKKKGDFTVKKVKMSVAGGFRKIKIFNKQ